MEGKERKSNGEHWRGKEICQDFLVFSQAGVRQVHVCVRYFKSRNHDLLKELKELDGIIVQRRRAVSDDLGSKVARCEWTPIGLFPVVRFGSVRSSYLDYLP